MPLHTADVPGGKSGWYLSRSADLGKAHAAMLGGFVVGFNTVSKKVDLA